MADVVRVMLRSNAKFMNDPHDDERWVLADSYVVRIVGLSVSPPPRCAPRWHSPSSSHGMDECA